MQKALLFGRLVKVSSQTCRQTTCKYQRYNLPKVFPKLTSSDTNALRADFLKGLGWTFPLGFRISRNIEQNFNLHFFFKFFCTNYKEPCRPFSPFTFRCVHGCPLAQGTRTFARYFFDVDITPLSLFCCPLLFGKRRSSRAFWSSFDLSYPRLVCLFVCLAIRCTQNASKNSAQSSVTPCLSLCLFT